MKRIVGLVILCLALTACSLSKEGPPADVIENAVKDKGSHYSDITGYSFQSDVESYTEENRYTRKIDDEVWQIIEVTVKLKNGIRQTVSVGFVKRGNAWYYRQM